MRLKAERKPRKHRESKLPQPDLKLKTRGKIHDTLTGYDFTVDKPLIRSLAIRKKCLECQSNRYKLVSECLITDCTLWPWRVSRKLDKKSHPQGVLSNKDDECD